MPFRKAPEKERVRGAESVESETASMELLSYRIRVLLSATLLTRHTAISSEIQRH